MLRCLYVWLLRLHPVAFRQRFGDDMLEILDNATSPSAKLLLLADGLMSVIRQWAFRPEFRRPLFAAAASSGSTNVPLFRTMGPYKPRPTTLFQGGLVTLIILSGAVGMIGKGSKARAFLIGAHYPSHRLLPVDRASVAESELNTTVKLGHETEDPWRPIASAYFKAIRVLDVLDADGDLTISQWEIITAPAALRRLDTNHDGNLSAEECGFRGANAGISSEFTNRARGQFMRANPVLVTLDANHDGVISASEIESSSSALRELDRNRDGSLTPDELIPDPAVTQAAVIMLRLDVNEDGIISQSEQGSEHAAALRMILQSADRNRDGLITREELRSELGLRAEQKREFDNARRAGGLR